MMKMFLNISFFLISLFCFSQKKFDKASVENFQKELDIEFADSLKSLLTKADRLEFKKIDFYPINQHFFIEAQFVRTKNEKPFEMKTSTERKPLYVKYGELLFSIDGKNFKLNIYRNIDLSKKKEYKNYLFLPFLDLTSGNESYGGGRYIDMRIPKGNIITIDFNKAYNPYCAYNHKYSCPVVPDENNLNIEIKAGVKKFHN
jgi:uncharacterized protein